MQGRSSTLDLLQDVGGLGCPDEGFWVFVVMVDLIKDRRNQLLDAAEGSADTTKSRPNYAQDDGAIVMRTLETGR